MQTRDILVKENEVIDTHLINKHFSDVYTDISELYDFGFEIMGHQELIDNGIKLVDLANKKTIEEIQRRSNSNNAYFTIKPSSSLIYPSSITDQDKITIDNDYGLFLNNVIHEKSLFTIIKGNDRRIKPGVTINKSSHNLIFSNRPESILDSNIKDILIGKYPYILKFVGDDVVDSSLIFDIEITNENALINTIKYTPFPIQGLMELTDLRIGDIEFRKHINVDFTDNNKFDRTGRNYLTFPPIETNKVSMTIENFNRIESLNGSLIGVSLIEAFETTYQQTSYFGYQFSINNDAKLRNIKINGTWANPYIKGINIRVYNDINEFNNISNNYLLDIQDSTFTSVNLPGNTMYYLLFIVNLYNGGTQVIKSIDVDLEFI